MDMKNSRRLVVYDEKMDKSREEYIHSEEYERKDRLREIEREDDKIEHISSRLGKLDIESNVVHEISNVIMKAESTRRQLEGESLEFEVSFGTYIVADRRFNSQVNKHAFFRLKKMLDKIRLSSTTNDIVDISAEGIRRIKIESGVFYEHKEKLYTYNLNESIGNVRIKTSIEKAINLTNEEKRQFVSTITRKRTRCSYHTYTGTTVDLTIVESGNSKTYEVEIEFDFEVLFKGHFGKLTDEIIDPIAKFILKIINEYNTMLYGDYNKLDSVKILEHLSEKFKLKRSGNETSITPFWNKPKNVTLDTLLFNKDLVSTVKLDGERKFLIIFSDDRYVKFYLMTPSTHIDLDLSVPIFSKEYNGPPNLDFQLLDVELFENRIYAFDIIINNNVDVRNKFFKERLQILQKLVTYVNKLGPVDTSLFVKTYDMDSNLYTSINKSLDETYSRKETFDGIILQSTGAYMSENYKWKPASLTTIDFYISEERMQNVHSDGLSLRTYKLFVQGKDGLQPFLINGSQAKSYIPDEYVNGLIGEFIWSPSDKMFKLYRLREDKDTPNFITVADSIFKDILRPISEDTMRGKGTEILRRYHNMIKKRMLETLDKNIKSEQKNIIDIGSGRGGDLKKWNDIGYDTVYCIEPNPINANELFSRAGDMLLRTNVKLYPTLPGIEDTKTIEKFVRPLNVKDKIDSVVAFFSLTYMMTTKEKYNSFINTLKYLASKNVSNRPFRFTGIVMERELVLKQGTTDNSAFKLVIPTNLNPKDIYGNEILISLKDVSEETDATKTTKTMVSEQTEWLFSMDRFTTSLKALGFKVETVTRLDQRMLGKNTFLPVDSISLNALNVSFSFVLE